MAPDKTDPIADSLLENVPVVDGHKVLGDVILHAKLGQGGFGAVYRGKHPRLDLDVAIKVMSLPPNLEVARRDHYVQRFIREARTAAAVRHTNLVRVIDVNHDHGLHYLVMDFVDGETAADRLARQGPLLETDAVKICLGVAMGLAEAHRQGIVHRDVKPENVLIERGRVRLTDLGLAKAYTTETESGDGLSELTGPQDIVGTASYMSPEQFASSSTVGPPADVWSLAVTLYELLTAKCPWTDSSLFQLAHKIMHTPPPDPSELREGISTGICAIIGKALLKEPEKRFPDCNAMAEALRVHLRWVT